MNTEQLTQALADNASILCEALAVIKLLEFEVLNVDITARLGNAAGAAHRLVEGVSLTLFELEKQLDKTEQEAEAAKLLTR